MGLSVIRIQEITAAVRQACATASLDFDALKPSIVPLSNIISSFPLRIIELPNRKRLTARSAIEFLGHEIGQELPAPDNRDRPLSGFIYVFEYEGFYNGCIFTEANDLVPRRRYSAAHELGHYLLHFLPLLEQRQSGGTSEPLILTEGVSFNEGDKSDKTIAQMSATEGETVIHPPAWRNTTELEREANRFAAELLMPSHACEVQARQYVSQFGTNRAVVARRLATDFFVSNEAMKWRLAELGLYTAKK